MGTHPIFESDFDCLTDNVTFVAYSAESVEDLIHHDGIDAESAGIKIRPGRKRRSWGCRTCDFPDIKDSYKSPLAKRIFAVDGVRACFFRARLCDNHSV